MNTKDFKYPQYIIDQVNKIAENLPNAVVTIKLHDGVYSITDIDIDGKYTAAMDRERSEINDALDEQKGLNLTDSKIALD